MTRREGTVSLFAAWSLLASAVAPAPARALDVIRADGPDAVAAAADSGATAAKAAKGKNAAKNEGVVALSPERAQLMLRSMTLPGWGQASADRHTAAAVFGLAELSIWTSFTAFRIQSSMRRDTYERTARLLAGIDLGGRDEEFRRTVGAYLSSEEYNQLVVYRDAANLYYNDPVAYRQYITAHSIGGANAWAWTDEEALLRYRSQRKSAQKAAIRANTALALAVVNRLFSMVHAARLPTHPHSDPRTWNFEVEPVPGNDAFAYRMGVRARF